MSEIMDSTLALGPIKASHPGQPAALYQVVQDHFRQEHLSPTKAGKLAAASGAKTVAATHIALERPELAGAKAQITTGFQGRIIFAEDLQTF